MLQRAASNAYSWWWASRIRTNQSKWLDSNLQEMNDRVGVILKLLGEEADSFAKRAEMYYKRRPEVIDNVEEAYRAYRALAERYDHVSGELHKANHTIAAAFPEQVQYAMLDDDDEDDSEHAPKAITPIDPSKIRKSTVEGLLKKKKRDKEKGKRNPRSDLKISMEKAQAEIDRLQKAILVLQTEKEFIKSSYENGIAKYWEIEKQMAEMQEEVCLLQDQSGAAGTVIEDEEARALMTATALKSCEEAIVRLKEQQKESADQARVESERIQAAIEQLNSIKGESSEATESPALDKPTETTELTKVFDEAEGTNVQQHDQLDVICEKVKKHFEMNPETSVEEIASKIDELVCKVIELEMTVSSLNTQINHLSSENRELEKNLKKLDEEKAGLFDDSNELNRRLKEAEKELKSVKELEKSVKEEEKAVASGFTEVVKCLRNVSKRFETEEGKETDNLSSTENVDGSVQSKTADEVNSSEETDQKVGLISGSAVSDTDTSSSVIAEEDVKEIVEVHEIKEELVKDQTVESLRKEKTEERGSNENALPISVHGTDNIIGEEEEEEEEEVVGDKREPRVAEHKGDIFSQQSETGEVDSLKAGKKKFRRGVSLQQGEEQYAPLTESVPSFRGEEKEGGLSWQELLLDGLEGRDKILLADYTAILRSYKETTTRLNEVEKRNQEQFGEMARLVQELRKDNAMKDEEIWSLKQLLSSFKMKSSDGTVVSDKSVAVMEKENLDQESDSSIEDKLRLDIDSVSEDNFKFMLKISASLNRTQEFETRYKQLESELKKSADESMADSKKSSATCSDTEPSKYETTEKKLRDLKTELEVWLEQITLLKQDLQGRVSSLASMRDEISDAVRSSTATDGSRLSVFQGEVLGLQLGNDKAEIELRAAVDLVSGIRIKVDSDLSKIKESFELPSSESQRSTKWEHFRQHPTKTRVPLRNFLFQPKNKPKKRPSFFACINPVYQRQYSDMKREKDHDGK